MVTEQQIIDNASRVLKRLRIDVDRDKVTQEDIAKAIGMHKSSYNQLELGTRKMHLLEMIRIAKFYEISLTDLAERLQMSPSEMEKTAQLQAALDMALKENAWLKSEIQTLKKPIS